MMFFVTTSVGVEENLMVKLNLIQYCQQFHLYLYMLKYVSF